MPGPAVPPARCRQCPAPPAAGRVLCPKHREQSREYHERRRRRLGAKPAPPLLPCGLTGRQLELVRLLYRHQVEHGVPPTMREVAELAGIASTNGVVCHLKALARKGWVGYGGASRSVRLRGLALLPAFVGVQGERLRRALEGGTP